MFDVTGRLLFTVVMLLRVDLGGPSNMPPRSCSRSTWRILPVSPLNAGPGATPAPHMARGQPMMSADGGIIFNLSLHPVRKEDRLRGERGGERRGEERRVQVRVKCGILVMVVRLGNCPTETSLLPDFLSFCRKSKRGSIPVPVQSPSSIPLLTLSRADASSDAGTIILQHAAPSSHALQVCLTHPWAC